MNWRTLERRLERGFHATPRHYGSSVVVERRRPFLLAEVMNEAISEVRHEESSAPDYWPGRVSDLLEEDGVKEQSLLNFYWDDPGPTSDCAGLALIGGGDRRYLCYWDEPQWYRPLAAVEPWHNAVAISATVRRVLAENGKCFGEHLFGSLPHLTTNHAPNLVPDAVVGQAYFDLLQWWEREQGSAWLDLAEQHYGRLVEPNQLQRCLDVLQRLPSLVGNDSVAAWLTKREDESRAIPDHARQVLFDEWFSGAYEEAVI